MNQTIINLDLAEGWCPMYKRISWHSPNLSADLILGIIWKQILVEFINSWSLRHRNEIRVSKEELREYMREVKYSIFTCIIQKCSNLEFLGLIYMLKWWVAVQFKISV